MASTLGEVNPLTYRGYVYDHETGLYYLQSRYYDPEIGRFFNADAFASTGQGLLGNNMFAYCGNNPVNCGDPTGHAYQGIYSQINYNEHDHTYGGLRSVNPVGFIMQLNSPRGTIALGITGSASGGVSGSASLGITADRDGNVGGIFTSGAVMTTNITPSYGGGVFISVSDADDIYNQNGAASQEGATFNILGVGISVDHSFFEDGDSGEIYNGYTVTVGPTITAPIELHAGATSSKVGGFNHFDLVTELIDSLT